MWQLVFAYIFVQGWVIDSDENGFFGGCSYISVFSTHNAKMFNRYVMTNGAVMAMD